MIRRAVRALTPDTLIVIGLFLLPLAFFWQVTLGGKTLLPTDNLYQYPPWSAYRAQVGVPVVPHNDLLSDLVLENLEWKQFIRGAIADREIPLWNPYLFAGTPFLAEGQHAALYPFSLIYYILPLASAYGWFTVSQLWLAGLLMFLFMRGLGARRIGAIFAAIVYQMSAFFLASVVFPMIIAAAAWLPFLLLMIEFVIARRPLFGKPTVLPWIGLGAIGLGMCILAGHVEFLYYTLLIMGFWAALRMIGVVIADRKVRPRWLAQTAAALIGLVVIGVGLGAIQAVPLFDLASHNFREGSQSFDTVRDYAYKPRHALEYLMPNLLGSPAEHDYFDLFGGGLKPFAWTRADGATVTNTYWEPTKNYVEGACYVGILTLILAAIAVADGFRRRNPSPPTPLAHAGGARGNHAGAVFILTILAVISVAFIFGTPLYAILYYGLPGVNQLHSPFRWVWPLTFALAALAGFGAENLTPPPHDRIHLTPQPPLRNHGEGESDGARPPIPAGEGSGVRAVFAFIPIGLGVLILIGLLLTRIFYSRLSGAIESLRLRLSGADTQFPDAATFYSVEFRSFLIFGVLLILSGNVIWLSRRSIRLPRILGGWPAWEAAALIVIALDLWIGSTGFNSAADPAWLNFTPPAIAWLQAHDPANWRMITIDADHKPLNANLGWMYGLQDVGGYDSIINKQYVAYMNRIAPQGMLIYNRIAPIAADHLDPLESPLLDELGVKYVLSEAPIDLTGHPKYKQVFADGSFTIYENSAAYARVMVAAPSMVSIASQSINQVVIEATIAGNQNVPVTLYQSYFPGWRAYAKPHGAPNSDEHEMPITLVDGNFDGIQLPPGAWTVRFRYSPPAVQIGAFASFIAAVLIVFMLLIWLWRRFYVETAEGDLTGVRRVAKNSAAPIVLSLFNRAIDFGFALVMLRVLSLKDAGTYTYLVVIIGWFDILTNFGLNTFLTRDVARDPGAAAFYLRRTSVLRVLLGIAWLPILLLFLAVERRFDPSPLDAGGLLAIGLLYLSLLPSSLNSGLSALFYALEKAEIPAAISTMSAIVSVILRLGALLAGFGIVGLAGANIAVNFVTLALLFSAALPLIRGQNRAAGATTYRLMIYESWPLMLNHLLATMFFKIDVTLLEWIKGKDVVAQYGAAYKWVDAIGVIPSFFTIALLPVMARQAQDDRPGLLRNYQLAVKMLVMVALPVAVVTTFLAPTLVALLGGARYLPDGAYALQLMIWFIPIGWINSLTQYVLIAVNLQRPLRWPYVAGVLFNIAANLLLIPAFSYQASSVITILSEVVLQVGFYVLIRRALGDVNWGALLMRPAIAAATMFAVLAITWNIAQPFGAIVGLIAAGVVYPGALLVLRPLDSAEIERLAPLLPGPLRRLAVPLKNA